MRYGSIQHRLWHGGAIPGLPGGRVRISDLLNLTVGFSWASQSSCLNKKLENTNSYARVFSYVVNSWNSFKAKTQFTVYKRHLQKNGICPEHPLIPSAAMAYPDNKTDSEI